MRRGLELAGALALVWLSLLVTALAPARAGASGVAGFGVETFSQTVAPQSPWPAAQAGSHPYALTSTVMFDHTIAQPPTESYLENAAGQQVASEEPEVHARIYGNPRDLTLDLPAGLIVDPAAAPPARCTEAELETNPHAGATCPVAAAVGTATIYIAGLGEKVKAAVYAMQAPPGVPALLGVDAGGVGFVMHILGRLTPDGEALTAEVAEIGEAVSIYGLQLTLWGDPSDPSHDAQRGACASSGPVQKAIEREKLEQEVREHGASAKTYDFDCPLVAAASPPSATEPPPSPPPPLLTLPGTCTGLPLQTTLTATSWQQPSAVIAPPPASLPPVTGCESLPFAPSLEVSPDTSPETSPDTSPDASPATSSEPAPVAAESPSGLSVALKLPRPDSATGLAEADPREVTLTLPAGLAISPAAAGGLEACARAPSSGEPESCPSASKLGELELRTPLLAEPLRGGVFLAQPDALGSLVGLYLTAAGDGVFVRLSASVALDPLTGQATVTLDGVPALPLGEVALRLFAGPRAALQTPAACGAYAATARLSAWSGGPPAEAASRPFTIDSGCAHGFAPAFTAGATDPRAGAPTPFTVLVSAHSGEQRLAAVRLTGPPGLLAAVGGIARCSEAQSGAGECPAASRIGEATLALGPGPDPYQVRGGAIYLTGPYAGAPLGLAVVFDVHAGPFDLGRTVLRARVSIDPHTARLAIESDPLPTILDGIPLDVRTLALTLARPGGAPFVLDPTDCAPAAVTATLTSTAGALVTDSSPFAVSGCHSLPFAPTATIYTRARTSRTGGASLGMRVLSGAGQANIARLRVILPRQLPGRLATLRHACPAATFDADPAACPAASRIGRGDARTRVLSAPLTGPAYLVSHAHAAFPDVVFVLSGEGFTIYLDGNLDISHGLTSVTFDSIPDVPVQSFTASFPAGPRSVLAAELPARAHGDMCGQPLYMPVELTAQDGAPRTHTSRIVVTGCPRRRSGRRGGRGGRGAPHRLSALPSPGHRARRGAGPRRGAGRR